MQRSKTALLVASLLAWFLVEPLLAIEPDANKDREGHLFVWSEQGICNIRSSPGGDEFTITGCEDEGVIANGCYRLTAFNACTAGTSRELQESMGCPADTKPCFSFPDTANQTFPSYISVNDLTQAVGRFSLPAFNKPINCAHKKNRCYTPDSYSLRGTCRNSKQQRCDFVVIFSTIVIDCPTSCMTFYNGVSVFYIHLEPENAGIEGTTPFPGCVTLNLPYHKGDTDEKSSVAARSSLVFFVVVNRYRTGRSDQAQEQLLEDSPLSCKGVRVHKSYVLTSAHCGQVLQNGLTGSHNITAGLIKVFKAGHREGIGYITPGSAFHYSDTHGELGNAALVGLDTLEDSSPYPGYSDSPAGLDHNNLYLLASRLGNTSTSSCLVELDSSGAELHKMTTLEHPSELWEGEPVFSLNFATQPFMLELVGWVDTSLEDCGNNFNEDCVSPVTDSVKEWMDAVLPPVWITEIPADSCFMDTTENPIALATETTEATEATEAVEEQATQQFVYPVSPTIPESVIEVCSQYSEKIHIATISYLTGIAVGVVATQLIHHLLHRKRSLPKEEML